MPVHHHVKFSKVGHAARKKIGKGSGVSARVHAARAAARAGGFNIGSYVSAAARGAHGVKMSSVGRPAGKGIGSGSASAKVNLTAGQKAGIAKFNSLMSGGEISHGGNKVSFKNGIHVTGASGSASITGNSVSVTRGGQTHNINLPLNIGGVLGMTRKLLGKYVG